MGLAKDIQNVLEESMAPTADMGEEYDLTREQKERIKNLAVNFTDVLINFLTKQTFTITEMKAILEVEEIKTAAPYTADVQSTVMTNGIGNLGTPILSTVTMGKKGVLIPKVDFKKDGGQGGMMKSKGHAYIGRNPVDGSATNEDLTKVKLLEENIVGR